MNVESVADKLAQDIRSEESLHGPMVKDLAKLAASTAVTEEDFHATFLKALGRWLLLKHIPQGLELHGLEKHWFWKYTVSNFAKNYTVYQFFGFYLKDTRF